MPLANEYDRFSSFLCICFPSYKSKGSDQKLSEVPSSSDILWFQDVRFLLKLSKHSQRTLSCGSGECICQGGCRQGGRHQAKRWGNMGTALTTSSGLEPIQGTLTWANCAYLLMNLPRIGCSGTLHSLATSATNFNHCLDWPGLGGQQKDPQPMLNVRALVFVLQAASPLNNAVWWQRYYHPELKYTPVMRQWKQSLQVCVANAEEANS